MRQRTPFSRPICNATPTVLLVMLLLPAVRLSAEEQRDAPPAERVVSYTSPVQLEQPNSDHPLYPALQLAERALESIDENIQDYTCDIVRRERIKGKLGGHELLHAKIRHEHTTDDGDRKPFSVYLRFLKPASVEGREALYVEGRHSGKVFVRRGGQRMAYVSTYIKPDSRLAMQDNRYPITEIGFKRMTERLVEIIRNDIQYDECEVNFYSGAKVDGRVCTRIEVVHPTQREHFKFHRATVYVDDEHLLPVAYASYYWPESAGEPPRLLEEYVYTDIELNVGLTDADFDRENPEYGFARSRERQTPDDE